MSFCWKEGGRDQFYLAFHVVENGKKNGGSYPKRFGYLQWLKSLRVPFAACSSALSAGIQVNAIQNLHDHP